MNSAALGGVLLLLLLFVLIFAGLARTLRVPYPILLVIAGTVLSFAPGMPRLALPPELVFLVFLPPLLYSAAWTLSWQQFQRNFAKIAMLAFGLVLVTILILTFTAGTFFSGFDWRSGLVLGAVVAATDAIAATSIARRMGLPNSIVALLEAESLVNDATGLLALQFGVTVLQTGVLPSFLGGVGHFVFLTVAGVFIGLICGFLMASLEKFVDDGPIEIVMSVLIPYAVYVLGERIHASGVMAVIACGMYMSRQSASYMSAHVRLQSAAVWDSLTFALNGVVFLMLGLQLPFVLSEIEGTPIRVLALYGIGFSLAMILLRCIWVFVEPRVSRLLMRYLFHAEAQEPSSNKQLLVVGWGGMRGVLSLAAAVSLPLTTHDGPFKQRSMIIFLSFCLIFSTLVLQGLSFPILIRRLGMAGHAALHYEEQEAKRTMLHEVLVHLGRRRTKDRYDTDILEELTALYQQRWDALPVERHAPPRESTKGKLRREALLDLIGVERSALLRLRDEGRVDDEVLRSLQRELDLTESRIHTSIA